MGTEIYYLSGTGNSLHIAKELQKRLPDSSLIPMVSLLNRQVIETRGETVGFVFPIHFSIAPMVVKDILQKMEFKTAKYIFAVATRCGYPCSIAFTKIEKILKHKGKSLNAHLILNMAGNDPKFTSWHLATVEEIANFEKENQARLDSFQKTIMNKEKYREKDTHIIYPANFMIEWLGTFFAELFGDGREEFYADEKCAGCGTCEKVCLGQKIKMIDGKPVWQKNARCFSCYACLNFCPQQAIQIRSNRFVKFYTAEHGRYTHPGATVKDIAAQK